MYDNKSIEIDLTNQNTKCVVLEIPQSLMLNRYFMVIKGLLGHADLLGMRTIIYVLTNHAFICVDYMYNE